MWHPVAYKGDLVFYNSYSSKYPASTRQVWHDSCIYVGETKARQAIKRNIMEKNQIDALKTLSACYEENIKKALNDAYEHIIRVVKEYGGVLKTPASS